MHEGEPCKKTCVTAWEVFGTQHAHLSNPVRHGQCCVHYPVKYLALRHCQSAECVCSLWLGHWHNTYCSRWWTWFGLSLLVINICLAIIENISPYPHLFLGHYMHCVHLHQLAINWHWHDILQTQKSNHTEYFDIWQCFQ